MQSVSELQHKKKCTLLELNGYNILIIQGGSWGRWEKISQIYKQKVIEERLRRALSDEEFQVYLQPQIELSTGKLIGAEALVRWKSPYNDEMSPNQFIPILERIGSIKQLDFWVLDQVCRYLRKCLTGGRKTVPIAVNLSKTYMKDNNFLIDLLRVIQTYDLDAKYIELEITESTGLEEKENFIKLMDQLKEKGFSIAMDDFGTGYSSLNLLKDLPIDVLKLDKSFIQSGDTEKKSEIIIRSMIEMAHLMDMKVVAEGVETRQQIDLLIQSKCDVVQGYYYAKPMPICEYEKYVNQNFSK